MMKNWFCFGRVYERNSNFELVRFLAAIGILLGHSASKGQGIINSEGINNLFFYLIGCFANMGSMLLAMISFYFMHNTDFSLKRIFKVWFKTIFYYSIITTILLLAGKVHFGINIIKYFFPVCGVPYWFVCAWIVFSIFRPIIDYVLKKVNDYKNVCIVVVILFSVIPFLFYNSILYDELTLFFTYYCIVVFIKEKQKRRKCAKIQQVVWGGIKVSLYIRKRNCNNVIRKLANTDYI